MKKSGQLQKAFAASAKNAKVTGLECFGISGQGAKAQS